jgi:alpha-D-ribose 1-methylphosphonate 5-triphosphate synthase subunit PhnG
VLIAAIQASDLAGNHTQALMAHRELTHDLAKAVIEAAAAGARKVVVRDPEVGLVALSGRVRKRLADTARVLLNSRLGAAAPY